MTHRQLELSPSGPQLPLMSKVLIEAAPGATSSPVHQLELFLDKLGTNGQKKLEAQSQVVLSKLGHA